MELNCQTAQRRHRERKRSNPWLHKTSVDCFVALLLAMTTIHSFAISPRTSREFCPETSRPQRSEGAGNAGRSMRPQPRVVCRKHHALVTTVTPETPGIPRAMVLTAYSALSRVTGLSCHPRRRSCLHQLDASVGASGPHDFAVREKRHSSFDVAASTASRTNVRDDRETPL